MKKIWADFKAELTIGRILFFFVGAILIVPLILKVLKMIPGGDKALATVGKVTATIAALLLLGMPGNASALPMEHATQTAAIVAAAGAPSLTSHAHVAPMLASVDLGKVMDALEKVTLAATSVFLVGLIISFAMRSKRAGMLAGSAFAALILVCSVTAEDTPVLGGLWSKVVIRQGTTANSLSNSLSVYDTTDTNRSGINSNGNFFVQVDQTNFVGATATLVVSNGVGGVRFLFFRKGILVSTNAI